MAEHTIEFDDHYNKYKVYEWGIYEQNSVLAGQTKKRFVTWFDTLEEARSVYPGADYRHRSAHNTYNHLPGEDDPVPGGMYPDDWTT